MQCSKQTKAGERCQRTAINGLDVCGVHNQDDTRRRKLRKPRDVMRYIESLMTSLATGAIEKEEAGVLIRAARLLLVGMSVESKMTHKEPKELSIEDMSDGELAAQMDRYQ